MITANYIEAPNGYYCLELNFPASPRKEYATVHGWENAQRLIYFHNRKYITSKLKSWLGQRVYAARMGNNTSLVNSLLQAQNMIIFYEQTNLDNICKMVDKHAEYFKSFAPGSDSAHRKHYLTTILPIITFCGDYMKGILS
jgi:hypothetical protein